MRVRAGRPFPTCSPQKNGAEQEKKTKNLFLPLFPSPLFSCARYRLSSCYPPLIFRSEASSFLTHARSAAGGGMRDDGVELSLEDPCPGIAGILSSIPLLLVLVTLLIRACMQEEKKHRRM